jgi:hypothetical protein
MQESVYGIRYTNTVCSKVSADGAIFSTVIARCLPARRGRGGGGAGVGGMNLSTTSQEPICLAISITLH